MKQTSITPAEDSPPGPSPGLGATEPKSPSASNLHRAETIDSDPSLVADELPTIPPRPAISRLDLGTKLEVLGELGRGGMGTVVKARHRAMNRTRAVKVLYLDESVDVDRVIERFRREAIIVSELSHPNVVKVFDLDIAPDGTPFMIMEYLEGKDLGALLAKQGRLALDETVEKLAGVADALDMVHGEGIVHRDLKPSNLFVTVNGEVKVLDFGISHVDDGSLRLTSVGEVVGTPLYIAPEQLKQDPVDGRADVYSLAAVAFEMLTGTTPFEPTNAGVLLAQVLDGEPRSARKLNPDLPQHVEVALLRGLAKSPDDRFSTARELIRAIAGPLLSTASSGVRRYLVTDEITASLTPTATIARQRRRRRARWLALGAAVLLLAVVALVGSRLIDTSPGALSLAVQPATVDRGVGEDPWLGEAVSRLVSDHLAADPRFDVVRDTSSDQTTSSAMPRLGVRLADDGSELLVHLSLFDADAEELVWRGVGRGEGFEEAAEMATWELGHQLMEPLRAEAETDPKRRARCGSTELCGTVVELEQSLVERGLLDRARRLGQELEGHPGAALWPAVTSYIRCLNGRSASRCLASYDIGPPPVGLSRDREALWLVFTEAGRQQGSAGEAGCKLVSSADPFVRGVAQLLPVGGSCADGPRPICTITETFLDRLGCLTSSIQRDDPGTALAYFHKFTKTDDAHGMIASVAALLPLEQDLEQAERWLERARLRHGDSSPLIADSMFLITMHNRDTSEALIWARRSPRALLREGLALQLDGWLRSGTAKAARGAAVELGAYDLIPESVLHQVLRPALHPVLLSGSRDLAAAWLGAIDKEQRGAAELDAAERLVASIRDADRGICELPVAEADPLVIERLYRCERWAAIVERSRSPLGRGIAGRTSRFLIADAHLNLGNVEEAQRGFAEVERDPSARALEPFTSLLALERLGRLAEQRGDREIARSRYEALLKAWNGLDTPLPLQLEISERLRRLEEQLETTE